MTYLITENPDGIMTIQVDFADENVDMQGETRVKGDEAKAMSYLPTFEADLRRNFADLFPIPEILPGGELL